jgi:hypothetical protein
LAIIIAGTTTVTTMTYAYAQVDRNFAGQVTSQATEDFREAGNPSGFGEHASNPTDTTPQGDQTGRNGLANALTTRGEPLHPSEVIGTICDVFGGAGCPP